MYKQDLALNNLQGYKTQSAIKRNYHLLEPTFMTLIYSNSVESTTHLILLNVYINSDSG